MGSLQSDSVDRRIFVAAQIHPDPSNPSEPPLRGIETVGGVVTRHFATERDALAAATEGPTDAMVIDCGDGHLFPSFQDTHIHQLHTGYDLLRPSLAAARSMDDVVHTLRRAARETAPGEWIYPSRSWHESRLKEQRLPTARDLDQASTEHPIAVRRGGHVVVANTRALELAGIDRTTADPAGGTIERYADGTPTGVLIEKPAFARVAALVPQMTDQERQHALSTVGDELIAHGVTYARDPGIFSFERSMYEEANAQHKLRVRSDVLMRLDTELAVPQILEQITDFGRPTRWMHRLRIAAVKLLLDGGVEAAATSFPYATNEDYHGHSFFDPDELELIFGHAIGQGWSIGCHAVGDAAIDNILTAARRLPAEQRIRVTIEHALLATHEQIAAVKELGLHVTLQHPLVYSLAHNMRRYWGDGRAESVLPTEHWLASGASISGGSDCNVTDFDPFKAVWGLETRQVAIGDELGLRHAVTRSQALSLHMGSLGAGEPADLICVPVDLETCSADDVLKCRPTMTTIAGHPEYDPDGLAM